MKAVNPDSVVIRAYNPLDHEVKVDGFTFQPGQSHYVSWLWMRNRYGDPRSKQSTPSIVKLPGSDQSMAVQPRETELHRINTIWGLGNGPTWEDIIPLEFYIDDERILTVYDDPSGMSTAPHSDSERTFVEQQDRISKLEQTLDMVLKATGVSRENLPFDVDAPADNLGDIPVDDGTASRTTSPWQDSEPIDALIVDDGHAVNG